MEMFKIIFYEKYNYQLIKIMILATFSGVFVANVIGPLASVYILYPYLNHQLLSVWMGSQLVLFILRIVVGKKIIYLMKINSDSVYSYLKIIYLLSFLTAFLFGIIVWLAVLNSVPDLNIFVIGIIIFGLAAGSIATLGSVFTAYVLFLVSNFVLLISAILYHGGNMFNMFALTMSIMLVTLLIAGYRQYIVIRNSISLDETFRIVYESSSDGVVISSNGRFINCNKAILTMFKVPSEKEFLATHISKFLPKYQPDGSISFIKMLKMANQAQEKGSNSFEWLHKDYNGTEFWCEIVLTKIHLNGKDLIHGVWRDISDRKAMNLSEIEYKKEIESLNENLESRVKEEVEKNMLKDRQLLEQSRLAQMGELISMIAHQWRQPLTAIASASTAIGLKAQLNKLDNDSATELSGKISTYVQHLSETIDDFRNFFKKNRHKVETNYDEIISSVLNIIHNSLKNKNIDIIQNMECKISFFAYPNELKQVILNLLKNAEDALVENNTENSFIKIKTYIENEKAILEVSDNGGGIDQGIIDKVFDPYFSTKLKKDGTGLGLYMSKIIVEEHCNGSLNCQNTQSGIVFKIEIDLA